MTHMNRRAILAGVATAAVAMPAAALPMIDPIYDAIEEHRRAYARNTGEDPAFADADISARFALLEIRPTTVAGAAALMRYAWEFSTQPGEEFLWPAEEMAAEVCRHLALSLETMA